MDVGQISLHAIASFGARFERMDEYQQARVSPTRFVDHSCSRGSSPKHSGFDVNGGLLRRPGERSLRQRPGRILKRTVSSALGRTVGVVILLFAVSCAHRGNGKEENDTPTVRPR